MRNNNKKTCKWILACILFLLLAGIVDVQPVQAAVKLNTSSVYLCVGDKYQLKLSGTTKKVTWKSTKTSVAKVSSKGLVTAKGKGTATIKATCNKKTYSCKVRVNKTFKVDQTSISIKKNTDMTAMLSVNGVVTASVADKKICSVSYGKWDGDYMPITITPKKVGSTTVTFTNSVNKEYCTLTVKVTALPSVAKFQTAVINTGADSLIAGENKFSVPFSLNRASTKTYLRFYDENGATIRSVSIGSVAANKKKTAVWDGKDDDGNPVSGTFTYAVIADGNQTNAEGSVNVLAASPFGKGDGTAKNPYLVSDLSELYLIRNYNGSCFAQDADIDFNYAMTAQLFDDSNPFSGTYDGSYDGKKHRMTNLIGYNSVFGSIGSDGNVTNVTMSNCVLNTIGSLLAFTNNGTIDSCTVDGKILCNAGNQAAMLVMYNKGVIRDCMVSGTLNVKALNAVGMTTLKAGGIVFQNSGTIAKCTSSVQIVEEITVGTYVPNTVHETYAGGIAAENAAGAFVTECVFTGSITANVTLPETAKDVEPVQALKTYSGFVAGTNNGYIGRCTNASYGGSLGAQGTGTGTVE
ncbi:MAG: FlgD immunoglobulin-like domain containing protein [bacterium]|nr:FlgD immunoglobulin-like domain containing protein [bacterium]MDY4098604.1 FlgD immunoglobulin-like domain containing protein [Lachnospiraceae bacterium]